MSKFSNGSIVRVVTGELSAGVVLADFDYSLMVIGFRVSPFNGRREAGVAKIDGAGEVLVSGWISESDLELVQDPQAVVDTAEDQFTGNDLGAEMAAAEAVVTAPPGFVVNDDGVLVQIGRE